MSYTDHGRRHGPRGSDAAPPGDWYYGTPIAPTSTPDDYMSGADGNAAFENGWGNDATADSPLRWRFVTKGRVEIVGAVDGGALGSVCVTLPAAFRPERDIVGAISSTDGSRVMAVSISSTTGDVTVLAPPASAPIGEGAVTSEQLSDTGVAAASYGDATHVAQFTVDADGRITVAANVAITYRPGGTDVALADGGTGASLADPNADRLMFWDDSAGRVDWLALGTGLSITGATLNATGGAGAVASDAIWDAKGDIAAGTGADTAAKVTVGANDTVLVADSAQTAGVKWVKVGEGMLALTDVTTANVSSAAHGFAPKSPADDTKFLDGSATPAWDTVKDSDLSTSDITTNNVTTAKHGFAPKAPNDATKFLRGDATWGVPVGSSGAGLLQLVFRYTVTGADKASIDTGVDTPDAGSNDWTAADLLEVWFQGRTDDAGAGASLDMTLNNDTSNAYDWQRITGSAASASAATSLAQARWQFPIHGSGGTANYASAYHLTIPNFTGTTFYKVGTILLARNDATAGTNEMDIHAVGYRSQSALTRLKVAAVSTAKLKVGSQLLIYKRLSA